MPKNNNNLENDEMSTYSDFLKTHKKLARLKSDIAKKEKECNDFISKNLALWEKDVIDNLRSMAGISAFGDDPATNKKMGLSILIGTGTCFRGRFLTHDAWKAVFSVNGIKFQEVSIDRNKCILVTFATIKTKDTKDYRQLYRELKSHVKSQPGGQEYFEAMKHYKEELTKE